MDEQPPLPPRVIRVGSALRPLLQRLAADMEAPVRPMVAIPAMDDRVQLHLDRLRDALTRLADACNALMTDVVANDLDGDAQVSWAVSRLAHGIDALLAGRREIRGLNVPWPHAQARDLLAGVYHHHLTEVRDWMGELLDAIDDPEAALRRRGLPTQGVVDLPITLTFTPAPQLHRLADWLDRRAAERGDSAAVEPKPAWWRKVGAFGIGWAVGHALFDDDCGCDGDV
jgi:hypothetical protein